MNATLEKIDTMILEKIAGGSDTFASIWTGSGRPYRVIDRRLQSLRKRGLIRYVKGRWQLVTGESA